MRLSIICIKSLAANASIHTFIFLDRVNHLCLSGIYTHTLVTRHYYVLWVLAVFYQFYISRDFQSFVIHIDVYLSWYFIFLYILTITYHSGCFFAALSYCINLRWFIPYLSPLACFRFLSIVFILLFICLQVIYHRV